MKKIEPIWNTVVTKYVADEKGEMRAVQLRNVKTKEERLLEVACVFVAIGHDPNTKAFAGKLETDPDGYLLVRHLAESKHPGVFIAGDVADRVYKQAITRPVPAALRRWRRRKYLSEHCAHKRAGVPRLSLKICDLTQFYSPLSGGVKRYVHEKIGYIQNRDE